MEVHHHPHLPHGKKKFKEYFLEFFMIFLAVTMGFLAESLRENISDGEKEHGYIESLVNNLKDDTMALSNAIKENISKKERLERLLHFTASDFNDTNKRISLYRQVSSSVGYYSVFKNNDATIEQLKNGGNLRYIKKDNVADSIAYWDSQVKIIYEAEKLSSNSSELAIEAEGEVLDQTVYYNPIYFKDGNFTGLALPLVTGDVNKIKVFLNRVDYEAGATKNYIANMQRLQPFLIRLITYLKKEYHLK